jgi:hypothetical protein
MNFAPIISPTFPLGKALGLRHDLGELISLEKPELSLLKLDPVTQARITNLLDKNNQGRITKRERAELERLVDGVGEPLEICEVGEEGKARLGQPPD